MQKIVLIGCNGGIGRVICNSLISNNYYIIGVDKNEIASSKAINEYYQVDLNDSNQILTVSERIKKLDKLWGIVFSAGVYPITTLKDCTIDLWDEVINVNLKSSFLFSKELGGSISNGGRIIFITSGAAYLGSQDIAYSASKSGVQGLAKGLAKQFRNKVLVNCISPGVIDTKMSKSMDERRKSQTIQGTLLGRIGQPKELTKAVLFLLHKENSYMTGATIDINGGLYTR